MLKIKVGSSWRPWLLKQGNTGKCHSEALLPVRSTAARSKGQIWTTCLQRQLQGCAQRGCLGYHFLWLRERDDLCQCVDSTGSTGITGAVVRRAGDGRQTAHKASYFTKDIFNTSIINLSFGIHSIFHFLTFLCWKWELLKQSCSPSPVTTGGCRMQREKWLVLIFWRQFAWKNQTWIFKRKGCLPGSSKLFAAALNFLGSEGQIWGWGVLGWLPHSLFSTQQIAQGCWKF